MWHNTSFQTEVVNTNWLKFFEPLKTSAPKEAHPHWRPFRTIIFYKGRSTLEKFDEVESQWDLLGQRWTADKSIGLAALAPFVCHHGEYYELCSNKVVWQNDTPINKGWHVVWSARRVLKEIDQRLLTWLSEARSDV
jgi:hypothetical protein